MGVREVVARRRSDADVVERIGRAAPIADCPPECPRPFARAGCHSMTARSDPIRTDAPGTITSLAIVPSR
jgi:hypothetical protein